MRLHPTFSTLRLVSSLLIAMGMLTGLTGGMVTAQEETPELEGQVYLISAGFPELHELDIPNHLDSESAQRLSEKLMAEQSTQLRHELRELERQGLITNIEPLGNGAYRLNVLDSSALPRLAKLESAGALQKDEGGVPACFVSAQDKLPNLLMDASKIRQIQQAQIEKARINLAAPNINIYISPYSEYTYIYGTGATPNSEVKLSIFRGGVELTYDYTFSDSGGFYYFQPDYIYCPEGHYTWTILKDDTVKVSSGGVTSQTVAAPISGWANPVNNVVFGTTSPNRSVRLTIDQINRANPCGSWTTKTKTGSANSAGNFSIDTTSVIDFNRSADVMLASLDANGHATFSSARTFSMISFVNSKFAAGQYLPSQSYTLVLKRGGATLESLSGFTEEDGWFFNYFSSAVQEGDKVVFTSGAYSIDYTVVDLRSLSVNRTTGQIGGTATPGLIVTVHREPWNHGARSRCYGLCDFTTVPSGANFNFSIGPIYKGEDIFIILLTPEGESFGYVDDERALSADIIYDEIEIYWPGGGDSLAVTLKDHLGAVLETTTAYPDYSYYEYYFAQFSTDLIPGDIIEVTGGSVTQTMTVQALGNPRLNSTTNRLTGTAPSGKITAEISSDFYSCKETTSTGVYEVDPGWDVKPDEYAYVSFRGTDGHYTYASTSSLRLYVSLVYSYVSGYVETPGASLTYTHKRGTTVLGSGTVSPWWERFYVFDLSEPPLPNDTLIITTSDGNNYTLTIPELTVNLDASGRRIYGKAPANRQLGLYLERDTADGYYYQYFESYSNSSGQYSRSLPKDMIWSFNCSIVDLTHPCIGIEAEVKTSEGFYYWIGEDPETVGADEYEDDDSYSTASVSSGLQTHSLDWWQDEDWVKFTVTQEDVDQAHTFHISTAQIGWHMDLYMELYGTDGATLLATAYRENTDGSGQGPQLYYTFSTPGEYYLRIHSNPALGDSDGGYCDSVYTLLIIPDEKFVYLPIIKR